MSGDVNKEFFNEVFCPLAAAFWTHPKLSADYVDLPLDGAVDMTQFRLTICFRWKHFKKVTFVKIIPHCLFASLFYFLDFSAVLSQVTSAELEWQRTCRGFGCRVPTTSPHDSKCYLVKQFFSETSRLFHRQWIAGSSACRSQMIQYCTRRESVWLSFQFPRCL